MAFLAQRGYSALRSLTRAMAAPPPARGASGSAAATAAASEERSPAGNHLNSTLKVNDILAGRGEVVFTTRADVLVVDAVRLMVDRNIGCLIVLGDDGEKVQGIMSERDYLEKIIVKGRTSRTTPVRDIMSEKTLVGVTRDSSLTECMELMTEKRVRHLPVLDGDKAVGMISIGDVVHALTESYKKHEAYMKDFISGGY